MPVTSHAYLRCPACGGALAAADAALACQACRASYAAPDDIPALLAPGRAPSASLEAELDREAARYPLLMAALSALTGAWMPAVRRRLVAGLGLPRGGRVLDHCTGPGGNLPALSHAVGPGGRVAAMDLSRAMLRAARRLARARGLDIAFHQADAQRLPYADAAFDAVFHTGAINQFDDPHGAVAEMLRVTRPGGVISILDEGVEPGRERAWRARLAVWRNAIFASRPPLDGIPEAAHPRVEWVLKGLFYHLVFRKP